MELTPSKLKLAEGMITLIDEQEKWIYEFKKFMKNSVKPSEYDGKILAEREMLLSRMKTALMDFTGIDYDNYCVSRELISYTYGTPSKNEVPF